MNSIFFNIFVSVDDEKKNLFTFNDLVEEFLSLVDARRDNEIYAHTSCAGK